MLQITAFKEEYAQIAAETGLPADGMKIFAVTDLDPDARTGVCLVCAFEDGITAVNGRWVLEKSRDSRRAPSRTFAVTGTVRVDYKDVKKLRVEEMLSTARIIAETERGDMAVAAGTFSCRTDMILFVKYCERLMKGGQAEGDPEDFAPELFCPVCGRRFPENSKKHCPYCSSAAGLIGKFAFFAKKYKWRIALMLGLMLLVSGIGVISPYFSSAFFYDKVLTPGNSYYGKILMVVLIVAGVGLLTIFVNMIAKILTAKTAGFLVYDLKVTIFESMKRLSLDFFTGRQTGGMMTQINEDASSIHWFFVDGLSYYVVSISQIIVVAVVMFMMQPLLAAVCVTVLPLFFWLALKTLRRQHYLHFKRHSASRKFNAKLTDSMGSIKVTKAFAMEEQECGQFDTVTLGVADAAKRINIFRHSAPPALHLVMYLSTLLVWGVGGWLTMKGQMTYGFFAAFISYCGMLNSPLFSLADMMDSFADCANAMRRLLEIHDAEPGVKESDNPVDKDTIEGEIEFRNVCFSYEKNRRIIDNVSFKVAAGEKLGIVGHSGAGKSTLANLLLRLYDTESGSVLIDGVDVKDMKLSVLRDNISIVSQETYIFDGTIFDNIAYSNPDASRSEVVDAARKAGAHEFIVKLEDGYQTKVGAGGMGLSGGERQRISIARAILKKPKILVLDEATASMDTKTERMIQISLDELSRGRTTITIAHRLSTLSGSDKIIVIEKGKLYEEGTGAELLAQDGIYRRLYVMQVAAMKNIIEEDE
jgi:ATP-binding cassette subfamily B protein